MHTTPPWAVERGQAIRSTGRLPCTSLVADGRSGKRPDGLDAVESGVGVTSLVSMPAETRCGRQRPLTTAHPARDTGEGRATRVVAPATQAPVTVEAVAQRLASSCGSRRTVSEGHHRPDRVCVCPQTGDAQHGWAPRPDRVAGAHAPPGGASDVGCLPQHRAGEPAMAPVRVATTASPVAIASRTDIGNPSAYEGRTKTSVSRNSCHFASPATDPR